MHRHDWLRRKQIFKNSFFAKVEIKPNTTPLAVLSVIHIITVLTEISPPFRDANEGESTTTSRASVNAA